MSESSAERPAPVRLNERTSIPLNWAVGIVLAVIAAGGTLFSSYTWLNAQFESMDERFDGVDRRLDRLERRTMDRWTRTNMQAWAAELRAGNREAIVVPPVGTSTEGN